jgi:(R,R)-butanediol dehydrogenase/meso-butanediol dehydrogenase/diacetyl reductase
MQRTMKASFYVGPEKNTTQEAPAPVPVGSQVLIRVKRAGICGTDLTIYSGKHPRAKAPLVMGHEIVGVVEAAGPGCVRGFQPGDYVTANPLLWCGRCRSCLAGNNHVCETLGLFGIDRDGGFAELLVAEEDRVHRLSPDVSWDEAALCEPVAVGIHAIRSSSFKPGDYVTIVGAGIIGALTGYLLLNSGAGRVTITDVNPWRLEQSARLGMNAVPVQDMQQYQTTERSEVVFECSGHPSSFDTLTTLAANSGEIVFVGIPSVPVPLFVRDMVFRELRTMSVRVYRNEEFAIAASLVSQRKLDLTPFVSANLPLEKLAEGIQMARAGQGWKVVMNPELNS